MQASNDTREDRSLRDVEKLFVKNISLRNHARACRIKDGVTVKLVLS